VAKPEIDNIAETPHLRHF